jgi:hypothetical protein
MTGQRKGTAIAMTDGDRDTFLRTQPVCRAATVGPGGHPHVSALWFVWDGTALWLNSLTRSQRWADIARDPRLSVIVDEGGADFLRLRGVELRGSAEIVGEVPRTGEPADPPPPTHLPFPLHDPPPTSPDPLHGPEQLFADKYMGGGSFRYDGRHGWLRVTPAKIVSWDFAKLRPSG